MRNSPRPAKKPDGTRLIPLLGDVKLQELTTSEIRAWHGMLAREVGRYSANRAKMILKAALALAAEDTNIRPPAMPANLGRGKPKVKKSILSPAQVAILLQAAREDRERGVYVAFPFLAGTRPSEQLGLLWEDVDFGANVIHIHRMQERDGSLTNLTKTVAGTRDIPMCSMLRSMLLEWRLACPRRLGELHRVFPGPGRLQPWPAPRIGGGGRPPLLEFSAAVLGACPPAAPIATCYAPQCAALVHLDVAGPRYRSRIGGEARRPLECHGDARTLYAGRPGRRECGRSAAAGIHCVAA